MSLNWSKTKYMVLSQAHEAKISPLDQNIDYEPYIMIGSEQMEVVSTFELPDCIIDDELSLEPFVANLKK